MCTEAEPGRRIETGGLTLLVLLLALLSCGPFLADADPFGPGSLLHPEPVCVGSAAVVILWVLFGWPLSIRDRSPSSVATSGALIFLGAAPFLAGTAFSAGIRGPSLLAASAVVASVLVVTGLYLAGPGRDTKGDRWFGAAAALFLVAIPFMNYALNEFGGVRGELGYRISPLLLVRGLLRSGVGVDPVPFVCLAVAAAGVLAGARRWAGAALLFVCVAGAARAGEVEVVPVLGDVYVPGRAVPLLVRGAKSGDEVWIRARGVGRYGAVADAKGARIRLPLPRRSAEVEVRLGGGGGWRSVDLSLRPVARGRFWVVALARVPEEMAIDPRLAASRAVAGLLPVEGGAWLAADAVLDPEGRVPAGDAHRLGGAGVPVVREPGALPDLGEVRGPGRRVWEEGESFTDTRGLRALFPRPPAFDGDRARRVFLVLACFALACVASLRYFASRGRRGGSLLLIFLALGLLATSAAYALAPPLPDVRSRVFRITEGGRSTRIERLDGVRDGVFTGRYEAPPLVLGVGSEPEVFREEAGLYVLRLPMREHETRIVVVVEARENAGEEGLPDLFIGPRGLARRDGEPMAPLAFLRLHLRDERGRTTLRETAVRRLLRLAPEGLPARRHGVRLPDPDRLSLHIFTPE